MWTEDDKPFLARRLCYPLVVWGLRGGGRPKCGLHRLLRSIDIGVQRMKCSRADTRWVCNPGRRFQEREFGEPGQFLFAAPVSIIRKRMPIAVKILSSRKAPILLLVQIHFSRRSRVQLRAAPLLPVSASVVPHGLQPRLWADERPLQVAAPYTSSFTGCADPWKTCTS